MKKNQYKLLTATLLLAVTAMLALPLLEARSPVVVQGGPPTITVTSITVSLGGCGSAGPNEPLGCVNVNWTATVPTGTTLTGFKVTVTKQGEATPHVLDNLPATARTAIVAVSATPVVPTGQFTADVTAKYSSSASGSKTGNF